jgi:hypothetical protein
VSLILEMATPRVYMAEARTLSFDLVFELSNIDFVIA